ncbi:unnamed protein product [Echinostoma caproni]|uniref:26S proteasome non-ATPase regulatory subunit 5 n=1 Tax=Echinostoma caproni TaxID=27848 RepID=A0A183A0M6_9TREM|nr:unnamed protein product [Echinostoma caproni]
MFDLACGTQAPVKASVRKGIATLIKGMIAKPTDKGVEQLTSSVVSAALKETLNRILGTLDVNEVVFIIGLLTSTFDRMKAHSVVPEQYNEALSILDTLLCSTQSEIMLHTEEAFGLILLDKRFPVERRLQFLMDLSDWQLFDRDVLPSMGTFLLSLMNEKNLPVSTVLSSLTRIALVRVSPFDEPCGFIDISSEVSFSRHESRNFVAIDCANMTDLSMEISRGRQAMILEFQRWIMSGLTSATMSGTNGFQIASNDRLFPLMLTFIRYGCYNCDCDSVIIF